jgi:1D-myo-inositol 3-kinase
MPRLLTVGHVTWDRREGGDVLGGSASYAALTARRLGWEAAVLTSAGPDFDPARDLPGIQVFRRPASATTRFTNLYDEDGTRHQVVTARADDVELLDLPEEWRRPDALLLAPVAGELSAFPVGAFEADYVGAIAQGWLREIDADGTVSAQEWPAPARDLAGVHALFLSEHDLPGGAAHAADFLSFVPIVALTRGWRGMTLHMRDGAREVPALPRPEVDPTGAGDVFAGAFLARYCETGDPLEAAAFACCAASCAVEGIGASTLGDRAEVERRLVRRQAFLEEGDWEE